MSPQPPAALVDHQLERMFVAALIAAPAAHDLSDVGITDLGDPRARAAYGALANLRASSQPVSAAAIATLLLAEWIEHNPDGYEPDRAAYGRETLTWVNELAETELPEDPPIALWAGQIIVLAETRRAAVAAAEPVPVRPARGPRAENVEPIRLAEAFRRYSYERNGVPTLVRWARAWWRYNGTRYTEIDDELLDRDLMGFLDIVVAPQQVTDRKTGATTTSLRRVTSRNKTLSEVRKALTLALPAVTGGAPQWTERLEGEPPADIIIACDNGVLDLRDLTLHPPTPRLFVTTAIGTSWLPDAPPPEQWMAFLRSLWGDDKESVLALQQMFGYLLTGDTSQQKMFALIGPPRSGKGTIARVLKALLGDDAVVNPTLQSLERPFGLAPLVGKTVAIIGDARLGGASDQAQVVERLLSISGEDSLSIDRKNRDPINVRLRVRVVLLTNELPRLYDTSGALASRFLILCLSRSFLGNEDTGLEAKLLAELPGILKWALEGRQDLAERGRFLSPLASEKAIEHLQAISSPIGVFVAEICMLDPIGTVDVASLYQRYVSWCESNGREAANKQIFGRDLHTVFPQIETAQYRLPDGKRTREFRGIRFI